MENDAPIILIVDDNPANISVLFEYLEESGFELAVAQSGEDALHQLQYVHPDLILLDIMMPGIDGFETCRRLKKDESIQDIPVIFMTAMTDEIDKVKGFLAGGVDYITKPLHHEDVLVRINAHLKIQKLQRQLQTQHARMQEQNALIVRQEHELQQFHIRESTFFSYLTHDVQSPLNSLVGFARLIDENLEGCHPEELKQNITRLRDAAEMLSALHENLLTWSQLQRKTLAFQPQVIRIDEIAAYHIVFFTPYAAHKGVILQGNIHDEAKGYADDNTVNIIMHNLIAYALDMTEQGGRVEVSVILQHDQVLVSVSDTGSQLTKEKLATLFQFNGFENQQITTSLEKIEFGLLLSKTLVEKNNGRIWIESGQESGTTFNFTLPGPSK